MAEMMSKEKMKEQMNRTKEQIAGRLDAMKGEAAFSGSRLKGQVQSMKETAKGNGALLAGAFTGIGALAALFSGGSDDVDMSKVQRQTLTEDYVDKLAQILARRMKDGMALDEALGKTLGERAPLLLSRPEDRSGVGFLGLLLGAGALAAAGWGIDLALRKLTGQGLVASIKQMSGTDGSYTIREQYPVSEQKYSNVHGTAGAEMPEPASAGRKPYTDVHGTAGAEMPNPDGGRRSASGMPGSNGGSMPGSNGA